MTVLSFHCLKHKFVYFSSNLTGPAQGRGLEIVNPDSQRESCIKYLIICTESFCYCPTWPIKWDCLLGQEKLLAIIK